MSARTLVLVVDDDQAARSSVVRILRRFEYDVVEAGSPGEVLDLVRSGTRPDVVICDVVLPGMNGVALGQRLREVGVDAPMIFVSGLTRREVLEGQELGGTVTFLEKPFSPTELADALDASLRSGGGGTGAAP